MPRYSPKSGRVPKLRRHATGCGTCKLNGRDVYFRGAWPKGKKTAPKAIQEQYERCISEWLAAGRQLPATGVGMTVAQLVQRYTPEVEKRYQKRQEDGTMQRTQNVVVIKIALRHLRKGWGTVEAREFRALALQAYVSHLEHYVNPVTGRLARRTINTYVWAVKRMFRWAAQLELFPEAGDVRNSLYSVGSLVEGATEAPDYEPIEAAPAEHVAAVVARGGTLAVMVQLQQLAGMRPGEVVKLRPKHVDRSKQPWEYRPPAHKTVHRGKSREVYFGPQARQLLQPLLDAGLQPDAYCFLNRRGNPYTPEYYADAIRLACDAAGVPRWNPNQLRHAAGTSAEVVEGIEGTAALLGNTVKVAQTYAHARRKLAQKIAEQIG
jgi:integrase